MPWRQAPKLTPFSSATRCNGRSWRQRLGIWTSMLQPCLRRGPPGGCRFSSFLSHGTALTWSAAEPPHQRVVLSALFARVLLTRVVRHLVVARVGGWSRRRLPSGGWQAWLPLCERGIKRFHG
jgi:hypothetical protein